MTASKPAAERLMDLLPQIFRVRDYEQAVQIAAAQGFTPPDPLADEPAGPLHSLLAAFGTQLDLLEAEVDWLYEDQFIETCADWVIPYIGALVGARIVDVGDAQSARIQVANTISDRRAKGTARAIASRARALFVAPAEAIEYRPLLVRSWNPNFPGDGRAMTLAINGEGGREIGLPHHIGQHIAEMRDIREGGRFAPANIGARVWTTHAVRHAEVIPVPVAGGEPGRFRFDPMGRDLALWAPLEDAFDDAPRLKASQIPGPIPLALAARDEASDHPYYPSAVGIAIAGVDQPPDQTCFCDLGDDGSPAQWNRRGSADERSRIRIDPKRGRFVLPGGGAGIDPTTIRAYYHFGAALRIGGAERAPSAPRPDADLFAEIGKRDRRGEDPLPFDSAPIIPDDASPAQVDVIFQQALDNLASEPAVRVEYGASIAPPAQTTLPDDGHFEIRGGDGVWPTLLLTAPWRIRGGAGSKLTLRGFRIAGDTLQVAGDGLSQLTLIDCTIVPGSGGLAIEEPDCKLLAVRSILGAIRLAAPTQVDLIDCFIDSGAGDEPSISGAGGNPGGILWSERTTIIGDVSLLGFDEASNSLFAARPDRTGAAPPVAAERLQSGCVRYSALPRGSRAPRRYRCFPAEDDTTSPAPVFASLTYGDAKYGSLVPANPDPLLTGAENGGEMGVGNRESYLRRERLLDIDLIEWTPFGMAAATELVTD